MRDPLRTRKLLAKIDREADLYVIADRMRQAIYDQDDAMDKLEARIHALEVEKAEFVTKSGVFRAIDSHDLKETKRSMDAVRDWATWAIRKALPYLLMLALSAYAYYKGKHE